VFAPTLAYPPNATEKQKKDIDSVNTSLTTNVKRIAEFDPIAEIYRFVLIAALGMASVVGTLVLLKSLFSGNDAATTITGGAVAISGLLLAGLMNPLQTVERDIIFRRWSDVIVNAFLLQAADQNSAAPKLRAVAEAASAQFASLAGAYAAVANKNLETLQIIAKPVANGADQADSQMLAVTRPANQTSAKDKELDPPLQIVAKGGDKIRYDDSGTLPEGLKIEPVSGKVTGKPTKVLVAKDVVVKVTDPETESEAKVKFKWTITADGSAPSGGG
jgi:hypothetical protein